jgi:cytochrome c biogenesis protein CcdA
VDGRALWAAEELGRSSAGLGFVATTFLLGLRHGIDWDHIAAISDVTASQETPRDSLALATLYAVGHAIVVFALGMAAILFGDRLPASVDHAMERVVGFTLVLLGAYVFVALLRDGRNFRMTSRWMRLFSGINRGVRWLRRGNREVVVIEHEHEHPVDEPHEVELAPLLNEVRSAGKHVSEASGHVHRHRHHHTVQMPEDPFLSYGKKTSLAVGMIHGVGAETPTQVLIFLAAAGAGSASEGVLLLAVFLIGLLTSNTLIALASTSGFLSASRYFRAYVAVSVVTASLSLTIGSLFMLGRGDLLPIFLGG